MNALVNFWNRYVLGIKSNSVREVATGRYATRKRATPRWIGRVYAN